MDNVKVQRTTLHREEHGGHIINTKLTLFITVDHDLKIELTEVVYEEWVGVWASERVKNYQP